MVFIPLIIACGKNKEGGGAVVLSFDDDWINEWYSAKNIFSEFNVHASFCIARPDSLSTREIAMLEELEENGHEIINHSMHHASSILYKDSIEKYIQNEVQPSQNILGNYNFQITTFAYPFGEHYQKIDSLLLDTFQYLRAATWDYNHTSLDNYDEIFIRTPDQRIFSSMGIDINYKISTESIANAFSRCNKKKEVLVLYAHKISPSKSDYTISQEHILQILKLAKEYNIEFITPRQIKNFFTSETK